MTTKLRQPEYPDTLNQGGWFLPTDYVLVKSLFREDLLRYYVQGMEPGARVLDLNAGTKGLGPDLIARGLSYTALEQNRLVRDVLTSQGLAVEEWRPPRIPRPDASVHLVLSLAFLEHLPGWISALEQLLEIKRVLVRGDGS